VEQR
jgi:hypothetical protein